MTSTLAVFEVAPALQQRFLDALSPQAALNYLAARDRLPEATHKLSALRIRKEVEFERAFVKAGGLLLAGADPTGNGSALAGFADQRNIELLVSGGFTFPEAIQIATLNGGEIPRTRQRNRLNRPRQARGLSRHGWRGYREGHPRI